MNDAELESSLLMFAIHVENEEIIHTHEEKKIQPEIYYDIPDGDYNGENYSDEEDFYNESQEYYGKCLKESIKCQYNYITNYLTMNYDEKILRFNFESRWNRKIIQNFSLFASIGSSAFFACKN